MMKAGKLSESVLKRSVLRQLHTTDEAQLVRPGVGMDFGAIRTGPGEAVVTATETRCLGSAVLGAASVCAALNNLLCSGARPLGVTVSLLLPTTLSEQDLRDRIAAIDCVCEAERLAVLGGHTEVTRSVTEPVLTVTAVGAVQPEALVTNAGARPGMDILVTKWIGLEGTAILAGQREEALRTRYAQPFVDQAKQFAGLLSVRREAAAAVESGVAAMHDLSEGGVFGALWELGQCAGVGLDIDLKKIPIRQETVEICEFFDLNPYKLLSGGSLLMAADDGNALVRAIEEAGGRATIIGKATGGNDRVLRNGEEFRFLETTQTDELWKLKK
jgi:hydrogenase maturation factor